MFCALRMCFRGIEGRWGKCNFIASCCILIETINPSAYKIIFCVPYPVVQQLWGFFGRLGKKKAPTTSKLKVLKKAMPKNKVCGAPGGGIYHTYILLLQRLISGKKRSNLTWNSPVYHSYIRRLHFIHQSLLWCLISLVTQERPTLHVIKDWWGVLVKDRGRRHDWWERGTFRYSLPLRKCWLRVAWPLTTPLKHCQL